MKKCSDCIYFNSGKTVKNIGLCKAPVPYWVMVFLEVNDFYVSGGPDGTAELCHMYTEDQEELE